MHHCPECGYRTHRDNATAQMVLLLDILPPLTFGIAGAFWRKRGKLENVVLVDSEERRRKYLSNGFGAFTAMSLRAYRHPVAIRCIYIQLSLPASGLSSLRTKGSSSFWPSCDCVKFTGKAFPISFRLCINSDSSKVLAFSFFNKPPTIPVEQAEWGIVSYVDWASKRAFLVKRYGQEWMD